MMLRAILPALGMAAALAACAQPASVDTADAKSTDTGQPGVRIANPRVPEASAGANPFPPVPAGYRGLGGALLRDGATVVIAPDMQGPMEKHDVDVGLLHGMAASGYSETAASKTQKADCRGAGDTPETAIKVANLADAADEVTAGIACARLLHPGTHWLMSQLVTKGDGYIAQVALRAADGKVVLVYTDINRLANQLIDELGG
jgi:hypothetical protein